MAISTEYTTSYAASLYAAQSTRAAQSTESAGSFLEITGDVSGSKYASGTDAVDISSQAREMLERSRSLDVFSCIFPNNNVASGQYKSLDTIQNEFMSDFSDFSAMFGGMSGMFGMGAGQSVTMGLDGKGGMTVGGSDEALAAKMGGAMTETMTSRFAVMAARAALVDAGHTLDGFGEQYGNNPVGAIEDNIDALKERLLGFRTVGGDGQMQYGFMRNGGVEYSSTTAGYGAAAA